MKRQHLITTISCLHMFTSLTNWSVFPYCWTCRKWIKPFLVNWQKILFLHLSRVWRCEWRWPSPKAHLFWSRWNLYFSGLKNRCDYSTHSKWWPMSQWCALHGTPHKLTITTLISLSLVSKVETQLVGITTTLCTSLNIILSLIDWLNFWNSRATSFWRTSKHNGYWCYRAREFSLNMSF